jgi:hippurate hydrolase
VTEGSIEPDEEGRAMFDGLTKHRRELHRIPELDFDLPETRAYVMSVLSGLSCEIVQAGRAGLCAYFDAGMPDTTAFRCDMDALPVTETNDVDYASTHAGRMHACGHDGHTAIMLGLAEELSKRAGDASHDALPRNALLIFQAAEETTGGAKEICDAGVFERYNVSRIFGLHLWPGYEAGAVVCRKGAFMAKVGILKIEIFGKSCHVAEAESGADALSAGARFISKVYTAEREAFPGDVPRLLKFGVFKSGTAMNVIPGHAKLIGTMRCFEDDVFRRMSECLRAVAREVEHESGCRVEIEFIEGAPAVHNDPELFDLVKDALCERAQAKLPSGDDGAPFAFIEPDKPTMTSEDFSDYQRKAPGIFFHLGSGRDTPLHSSSFDIDESALLFGVKAFLRLLYTV